MVILLQITKSEGMTGKKSINESVLWAMSEMKLKCIHIAYLKEPIVCYFAFLTLCCIALLFGHKKHLQSYKAQSQL